MESYSKWEVFRHLYLALINEDETEILHSIKINNWLKEIIRCLCDDKTRVKEIPQVGFICAILPFYEENIFGKNAIVLIESMMKLQPAVSSYLWHALLDNKCKIEKWDKDSFTGLIKCLIEYGNNDNYYNHDIYDYMLDKILTKYNNIIVNKYAETFASIFVEWCLNKEKKSPFKLICYPSSGQLKKYKIFSPVSP